MKKILFVLLSCLFLSCCGNTVSQEEYDAVIKENEELKNEIQEKNIKSENVKEKIKSNDEEIKEKNEQESEKEETVVILAEYTLPDGIGWYTRHFMIIKNISDETVDVSTSSIAYDNLGNIVGAADSSFDALGSGCTSICYEPFETESEINNYDTKVKVSKSEYYESVIQDLSYVQNDIDGGAVLQVTNNGKDSAEFVEGYVLYFLNNELVEYEVNYFTDDDSEIKPGDTISKQFKTYKEFDRIEFYLTGRR